MGIVVWVSFSDMETLIDMITSVPRFDFIYNEVSCYIIFGWGDTLVHTELFRGTYGTTFMLRV